MRFLTSPEQKKNEKHVSIKHWDYYNTKGINEMTTLQQRINEWKERKEKATNTKDRTYALRNQLRLERQLKS